MASQTKPFDVSSELAKLKHEKRNQEMRRLPASATIQRRPINHPSIASPFAGSHAQKVVYVSRKTPLMSAVKRVARLLHEIEKRATQDVKLIDRGEKAGMRRLAESRDTLVRDGEEVLVKASGRAMEQALRVGEWFRTKETHMACKVEVRTGSVSVVDDIVEVVEAEEEQLEEPEAPEEQDEATVVEGGDTTLELLGDRATSSFEQPSRLGQNEENAELVGALAPGKSRKRKRKKRPAYEAGDLPEQRLRWVKTVEVAISFKA